MMNAFFALGVVMLVTACSLQHSQDLPFPTVQLPSNVSDVATAEIDGYFVVHVGQVPIVLTTDFVPE
jgi:hypothetical protein